MKTYLEHVNITVPNIDAAIAFLKAIDPGFWVRYDETPPGSYRWAHVGNDDFYVALQGPHPGSEPLDFRPTYTNYGVNHAGFVVNDLDAVVRRLEHAGYKRGMDTEGHPHRKRAYYFDSAGFEWEVLEYLSDDPDKRNSYV